MLHVFDRDNIDRRAAREKKFIEDWNLAVEYLETKGAFETNPSPSQACPPSASASAQSSTSNIANSVKNDNVIRKRNKDKEKKDEIISVESIKVNEISNDKEEEPFDSWLCTTCVSSETSGAHLLIGLGVKIWWRSEMNFQKGIVTAYDQPSGSFFVMCVVILYAQDFPLY